VDWHRGSQELTDTSLETPQFAPGTYPGILSPSWTVCVTKPDLVTRRPLFLRRYSCIDHP